MRGRSLQWRAQRAAIGARNARRCSSGAFESTAVPFSIAGQRVHRISFRRLGRVQTWRPVSCCCCCLCLLRVSGALLRCLIMPRPQSIPSPLPPYLFHSSASKASEGSAGSTGSSGSDTTSLASKVSSGGSSSVGDTKQQAGGGGGAEKDSSKGGSEHTSSSSSSSSEVVPEAKAVPCHLAKMGGRAADDYGAWTLCLNQVCGGGGGGRGAAPLLGGEAAAESGRYQGGGAMR